MGTWNIKISGHGQHHNPKSDSHAKDAEVMAMDFVDRLRAAGHEVSHGTLELTGGVVGPDAPAVPDGVTDLLARKADDGG